jgi:hypothetical protein
MTGWHFIGDTLRDGRPVPPDGEWLEHSGPLVICISGLHFGHTPWDALQYAPGPTLCYVEVDACADTSHTDKGVCRRRKILSRQDLTPFLREFARAQALSVIQNWDAPEVVKQYLTTGDESIRSAAESATWSAAWSATWSAAWNAAQSAAWNAAWNAAESAAWNAAWNTFNSRIYTMFQVSETPK